MLLLNVKITSSSTTNIFLVSTFMNSTEQGKLSKREKCLKLRSDCDLNDFKCLKCDTDFSSLKTLHFHMFSVHAEKRLYYKCPVCDYTFVQLWSVCRHLMKVHKKTKEETDLLKMDIKTTTFPKPGNIKSSIHQYPTFDWKNADFEKLKCLCCSRSFSTPANLRKHVARRMGLVRFWCKLCDFKTFNNSECRYHVRKSHSRQDPQKFIEACNTNFKR
ncbi:hypothetical protein AVEN_104356-1 [Araneus ventricosus]|uniref:C2H2-type domain-containing protein n=1 Tax=Araneus ventricosus TaxID=182803 RepID=A0A4Y2BVA1_ARAVE|nr:hypothetical protein AVEN_104356-1 [Araneus ventricosus]